MKIKNSKAFKNYQRNAPPKIEVLSKEKPQWRFQKDKLKPFLVKVACILAVAIGGYFLADLPGVLIGAIFGQQLSKLLLKLLAKYKFC